MMSFRTISLLSRPFSSMSVATAEKQLVIVGLGNLPLPRTRHRYALFLSVQQNWSNVCLNSVGNLIIDALAARWGVRLSTNRSMGGTYGKVDALIGDEMLSVTLLKPRKFNILINKYITEITIIQNRS